MIFKSKIVKIKLKRDLTRKLKQGHPWVFEDTLADLPAGKPGQIAKLVDRKNKVISFGIYNPESPLAFRAITLTDQVPNSEIIKARIQQAIKLRLNFNEQKTTGFRLINGEGDLLPGLVVDVFNKHAVLQLDGPGPFGFYDKKAIADYITKELELESVYFKARHNSDQVSEVLVGNIVDPNIVFIENGVKFSCNIQDGQKTGFFLDQRDNRFLIRKMSKDKNVLNMFSYTGGFSINAGIGGAKSVSSVDISKPASDNCDLNWKLNELPNVHTVACENCFDFIASALSEKKKWDLVIVDPPSFAPSKKSLDKAITSYQKIFSESIRLCEKSGLFAASSCSSHIDHELFMEICTKSISLARRKAQVLYSGGQGTDHPFPLALPEMRYLKFVLFQLD